MTREISVPRPSIDQIGASLSALCLVHCVAFPLLVASLPTVASAGLGEPLERGLVASALLLGGFAFQRGFRKHGHRWVLAWGLGALALLAAPLLLGHEVLGESGETLTRIGSLALLAGHLWNHRVCCLCACEE